MENTWKTLQFLETEPAAKRFLTRCYVNKGLEHAERLAFQQSSRFCFLWKQARLFYKTAETADLAIQPLLLFYGCTHLLKGMLLSQDPGYPHNSKVLQHGVTTRKIKRGSYVLSEDEVRPQKEGLFPLLAHTFELPPLHERYYVGDLFLMLAPFSHLYASVMDKRAVWIPLETSFFRPSGEEETASCFCIRFPERTDGPLCFSQETLSQYIRRFSPGTWDLSQLEWKTDSARQLILPRSALSRLEQHPLFYREEGTLYFWNSTSDMPPLPAWASHFMLLYLLSMLCRYETEWWGELTMTHGMAERYLVERFLDYHAAAFPAMVKRQLEQRSGVLLPP
jgi:hypothetical protein